MKKFNINSILVCVIAALVLTSALVAQEPYRRGTTAANFLEIGYGSRGIAMGDAVVASTDALESAYWNPAGLALMRQNEVLFNGKRGAVQSSGL